VPTAVPTAVPIVLTNEQMVAAAIAAFDAAPEPADLIAWDHLDAEVAGDKVTLRLCSWTGESVFDEVRLVNYLVEPDVDGNPTTQLIFSNPTPGECLNTQLVNSAFEAIEEHEVYWSSVLADPTTFDQVEAARYQSDGMVALSLNLVEGWVRDGLSWEGAEFISELSTPTIAANLYRSYELDQFDVFEVLSCRNLDPNYGLYQGTTLIDDFRSEKSVGTHVIDIYILSREQSRWIVRGGEAFVWSDCLAVGPTWLDGVNDWRPEPARWSSVEGDLDS